ncbi:hypothetical protein CH286_05505 [Rhodococcus sp. WWJCD1]|uniref:glycosyltransferase family 4 protein n=1 Tax=Rhodococcus sp. WWJCD1 TaxID=2022519 RepID=UPI000B9AD56D|nr:hypothetical protein CH286_05505 [Rhodococcus sp. WWJCD1]
MKVGLVGGVPSIMGGGGLEVQIGKTADALRSQGVDVVVAGSSDTNSEPFDLIHMFGADPANWNYLRNWSINRCSLVVSPILVFDSLRQAKLERYLSRIRVGPTTTSGMRRGVVLAADHVVALHEGEREQLMRWYGVPSGTVSVVPNGSEAKPTEADRSGRPFFICAGTINSRKDQLSLIRDWPADFPDLVLVGPLGLTGIEAKVFERLLRSKLNVNWLGKVSQSKLWLLQETACATVSYSQSEGESLVVLDSLALSTPVLIRESGSTQYLRSRYGDGVLTFTTNIDFYSAVKSLKTEAISTEFRTIPSPLSWSEVGNRLVGVYQRTNGRTR